MRHQERRTSTFVQWVRGHGAEALEEEEKRFCAILVIFRRYFHILIIVLCVHFIPHYCIIVDKAKFVFEIPIYMF